jgi:VanZ family protein
VAVGLASRIKNAWALLPAFVGAVMVGALDELLQRSQPHRAADWVDFLADVTGAALGCLALVVLAELRDRLVKHPLSEGMD